MPYSADISRTSPGCFLFLVDRSGSMEAALAGQPGQRKMDQASDAINRILDAVTQRCSQGIDVRITSTSASWATIPTARARR